MIGEMIKEYLVGLGVKIDKPGFAEFDSTINKTTDTIGKATKGWGKDFITASGIVATAIVGVTSAAAGLMTSVAKQDLAMDKYARSMMVSKSAAVETKQAIDALGESMQDIQLNPELFTRYRSLVADGRNMKVGGDYSQTMKDFRSLIFEFTRLKQEAGYALQWVGYYLMKHLSKPLEDGKKKFQNINDSIIKTMSVWTEKIARTMVYIVNIGRSFWSFIKAIGKSVYELWNAFPRGVKIATAALTGFFMLLKASPMGRMITLVSTLFLLIDDYFGHMEGRQAAFGEFWDKLRRKLEDLTWVLRPFNIRIKALLEVFSKLAFTILKMVKEGLQGIFAEIEKQKALPEFLKAIENVGQGITDILKGLDKLLIELQKSEIVKKFWRTFKEGVVDSLKQVSYLLSGLGHLGSAIGKLMTREYEAAQFHAAAFQAYMIAAGADLLSKNSKGPFGLLPPNDNKVKSINNYLQDTQGREGVKNHCTIYTNEVYEKGAGLTPDVDFPASTWAPTQYDWYKEKGLLQEYASQEEYIANMRPGDQVHWWYGKGVRETDHVGIVGIDGKVYQWGETGGTQGISPNYAQIIGIARPSKLNELDQKPTQRQEGQLIIQQNEQTPQVSYKQDEQIDKPSDNQIESVKEISTTVSAELMEIRRLMTTPLYKSIPEAREKELGESFTGWLGSKVVDFFSAFSKQAALLNAPAHVYNGYYSSGTTTVRIGDINVNVVGTNLKPDDVGNAVAAKTTASLEQRSQYVLQNRTLGGGSTWT